MALTKSLWFYLPINPEPWAVGDLSIGKRNGKMFPRMGRNQNLYAFQQQVREWFPDNVEAMPQEVDLYFYFWHQLDTYIGPSGRKITRNPADATNMQKACEDALQKVLYENDRQVRRVGSEIVAEGKDVQPGIAIRICGYNTNVEVELPGHIISARLHASGTINRTADNSWPPKE